MQRESPMLHHKPAVTHFIASRLEAELRVHMLWQACYCNTRCTIVKTNASEGKMDASIGSKEILLLCLLSTYLGVCESQAELSVRVIGGPGPREGRVEVYHEDLWSTVSRDGWTEEEAVAVCSQLGFVGPARTVDPESPIIAFDVPTVSVDCPEGASSLHDCRVERTEALVFELSLSYLDGHPYWDHSEIAGVVCENAEPTGSGDIFKSVTIVLTLVLIVFICIIAFMWCRLKKKGVPVERNPNDRAQPEAVAMHSIRIEKDNSDTTEDGEQEDSAVDPATVKLLRGTSRTEPSGQTSA